jgi:DeoR/GlpR family transcriptional regulator of sugar metabolism
MNGYSAKVEAQMRRLYHSLAERDRRRYAAVEVEKLGHGGLEYVAQLFGCDPKTIRRGMAELESEEALTSARQRKKGADGNR